MKNNIYIYINKKTFDNIIKTLILYILTCIDSQEIKHLLFG